MMTEILNLTELGIEPPREAPVEPFDGLALVATLPHAPGVYRMYDRLRHLLYVGKAKDLKKRVNSYFSRIPEDNRIRAMVARIADMEITVTRTEAEALVLESQLIKAQHPHYNISLRDGRGYPHLRLTVNQTFPRLTMARGRTPEGARDFGPFPSGEAVKASLNVIQKTFQLRNCEDSYFKHRSRPCLQHSIGRCSAPCVNLITAEDYQTQVQQTVDFLEGRSQHVIDTMGQQMEVASDTLDFERAALLRDRITHLSSIQAQMDVSGASMDRDVVAGKIQEGLAGIHVWYFRDGKAMGSRAFFPTLPLGGQLDEVMAQFLAQHYLGRSLPAELIVSPAPADQAVLEAALSEQAGKHYRVRTQVNGERARHLALAQRNVAVALSSKLASVAELDRRYQDLITLLELPIPPQRIECFDISHTRGEATVASCVVFGPHGARKSDYRRYNISGITPGDDYAAMAQVLGRRLRRLNDHPEEERPDLWLIDGGAGQVQQAVEAIQQSGRAPGLTVVGVAKGPARRSGDEDLVRPGRPTLHPGPGSPGLHFIQAVRDEAHRFAIAGHRKRRQATRDRSPLEGIAGVGPAKRQALLRAFGGFQGVEAAGVGELTRVPGIHLALAQRIYRALHDVPASND